MCGGHLLRGGNGRTRTAADSASRVNDGVCRPSRVPREKSVIDNPFRILPGAIPNLASHILAMDACAGTASERYNTTPVLIETLVETPRYTGAVYKASGWIRVGTTQGRGRYDRYNQYDKPRKDIWLRPLRKAGGEQTRPCPPHLVRGFDTRCPLGV